MIPHDIQVETAGSLGRVRSRRAGQTGRRRYSGPYQTARIPPTIAEDPPWQRLALQLMTVAPSPRS